MTLQAGTNMLCIRLKQNKNKYSDRKGQGRCKKRSLPLHFRVNINSKTAL